MAIVATITLLPFCRRDDLVLRSRRISSDEQDHYPDDQTETEPHILAKATEKPEHGREPGCHNHQPTIKHQNNSRAVRRELGPSQRFLGKYDESDGGRCCVSHAEREVRVLLLGKSIIEEAPEYP